MHLPSEVSIVEVGPRDGLQSLPTIYPISTRLAMIEALLDAGLKRIEVTSFVRPDVLPQLSGAEELVERLPHRPGCSYRALVANRRGAERAAAAGMKEMLGLTVASETYARKNQNMTIAENMEALSAIAAVARDGDIRLVVIVGLALFCPYEGDIPQARIIEMVQRIVDEGVEEVVVASTAGLDGPRRVHDLCALLLDRWPEITLGLHLHNANGLALTNALAAMQAGATVIESSICGLGGGLRVPAGFPPCGNTPTEDLVAMLEELGIETGVRSEDITAAGHRVQALLGAERLAGYVRQGATKARALELGRAAMSADPSRATPQATS